MVTYVRKLDSHLTGDAYVDMFIVLPHSLLFCLIPSVEREVMYQMPKIFRFKVQLFVAFVILVSINGFSAEARTFKKTVASGKNTFVNTHHRIRSDCKTKPISIDIVEPPKNGVVTAKLAKRKLDRYTAGKLRHCYGRMATFINIYYRSNEGFEGTDSFKYRRVSPQKVDAWNKRIVRMKIAVE